LIFFQVGQILLIKH